MCLFLLHLRKLVLPDDGAIEIPLPSSMKFYQHLGRCMICLLLKMREIQRMPVLTMRPPKS